MMTTSYLLYKISYSPYSYVSWAKGDLAENKYEQYLFVMFKFDLSERTTEKMNCVFCPWEGPTICIFGLNVFFHFVYSLQEKGWK
jgi:hypothetical protein